MLRRFYIPLAIAAASFLWPWATSLPAQSLRPAPAVGGAAGSCVGCHDGSRRSGMREHLVEWRRSAHGTSAVACTDCHGGDASAQGSTAAHAAHVNGSDPLSATNVRNLGQTCGRCHQEIVAKFAGNPHLAMIQRGERLAPNCVTCHGEVAADMPSPARVGAICAQCHSLGKPAGHAEYPALLQLTLADQQSIIRLQGEIRRVLERLGAGAIRDAFMAELNTINDTSRRASAEGHGANEAVAVALRNMVREATMDLMKRVTASFIPASATEPGRGVIKPIVYVPAGPAPGGCDPAARPADLAFVVKDMDGRDVRFADYQGRVILLNFWATWCAPCKVEVPWLVDLQSKYRSAGLQVLGFAVDDPPEKLKPYAAKYRINYPVLQGLEHQDVQDAYGPIWGVPMTFLISRDARRCRTYRGIPSKEVLEAALRSLL